jgi:hypothetical protein
LVHGGGRDCVDWRFSLLVEAEKGDVKPLIGLADDETVGDGSIF